MQPKMPNVKGPKKFKRNKELTNIIDKKKLMQQIDEIGGFEIKEN